MGSPLFQAALFAFLAFWVILFMFKGLKRPPPGFEPKICEHCEHANPYSAERCEKCKETLKGHWDDFSDSAQ